MWFDPKETVAHLHLTSLVHPSAFIRKVHPTESISNMFDDGVAMNDLEPMPTETEASPTAKRTLRLTAPMRPCL
jgi:hypothetical protein